MQQPGGGEHERRRTGIAGNVKSRGAVTASAMQIFWGKWRCALSVPAPEGAGQHNGRAFKAHRLGVQGMPLWKNL